MKRHKALQTLSDEHHQGLVWSRRLQNINDEASPEEAQSLADDFIDIWNSEINPHFRKEEEILLPLFANTGKATEDPVMEMLEQHILLRRDVLKIGVSPNTTLLQHCGNLLKDHIRHEERVVFPMIEEAAQKDLLTQIGEMLKE